MRFVGVFAAGALIGALLACSAYHLDTIGLRSWVESFSTSAQSNESSEAGVKRQSFTALGTIEPKGGVINVSSPLIGQRIEFVTDQDPQKDSILVELDQESTQHEIKLAEAQLEEARQQQKLAISLADQQIEAAQTSLAQIAERLPLELKAQQIQRDALQAKIDQAVRDRDRLVELKKQSKTLATDQDVEHANLAVTAAKAELEAVAVAKLRLEQTFAANTKTAEAKLQAATEQKNAAKDGQGITSLEQQVALVQLKLEQTTVKSPISGTIIKQIAHVGELVAQRPLFQIADLDSLTCIVEVEAADIRHVKEGDAVTISGRLLDGEHVQGHVVSIGNTVRDAVVQPFSPLAAVDRDIVEVVVEITETDRLWPDKRRALLGLQVEVQFAIDEP